MIASDVGVLATLLGICAFWFALAGATRWRVFTYLPPLVLIYSTPVALSNTGVLPGASPVYDQVGTFVLPMMLALLLLGVDLGAALRVMGRAVFVMLFGTLGVVLGAPLGFLVARDGMGPEGWKAFGTLAGSWIGGTGNLAGVAEMIGTEGTEFGLAVLADNLVYVVWLPVLLGSRALAERFGRFTGAGADRVERMERAVAELERDERPPSTPQYLYLLAVAAAVTWASVTLAPLLPEAEPYLNTGTWRILLVTTLGIGLSFTALSRLPGSHQLAMALVYLYVARMGASASLEGVAGQAGPFLLGALVMVITHGAFCLLGARLLRVDVHSAAIASAANVGGAASAPVVAAHHNPALVPASILMALIGYAVGNYAAWGAAMLCRLLGP